uniref:Uncharacterized protein n=1 Tax=Panagrolaimus superbus TaxID=310955 RepID=A0A914ZBS6_9BILA
MWKAAKRLQTKDRLATKWSLTIKDESNNNIGNLNNNDVEINGESPTEFTMLNGKRNSSFASATTPPPPKSSPKRLHRPSHFFRMPLVEIGILSIFGNKARLQMHTRSTEKGEDKARKTLGVIIMLNPLIYCKYNREFRIPFREMLCCRFRTIQNVMRNESFKSKFGPPRFCELKRRTTDDSTLNDAQHHQPSENGNSPVYRERIDQI